MLTLGSTGGRVQTDQREEYDLYQISLMGHIYNRYHCSSWLILGLLNVVPPLVVVSKLKVSRQAGE